MSSALSLTVRESSEPLTGHHPQHLDDRDTSQEHHSTIPRSYTCHDLSQSSEPDETANHGDSDRSSTALRDDSPASSSRRNRRPLKKRTKTATVWRPLDLREQAELDNAIIADHSSLTPPSAFDVHAKTFRPSAGLAGFTVSDPNGRSILHNPSSPSTPDPDAMFKSTPASGLNAYEIRSDAVNATVTAAINRRELTAVFGSNLPSPGVCQTHPGQANGQIQFCVHPNGDVSAHQWFSASYQWLNIGQFSNIRKRTEGQLASDRLRGETESQSLQQNTLAYFRAVAKQRESSIMRPEEVDSSTQDDSIDKIMQSTRASLRQIPPGFNEDSLPSPFANRDQRLELNQARADIDASTASLELERFRPKRHFNDFIKGAMTREGSQLRVSHSVDDFDAVSIADTLSPSDRAMQRGMSVKRSVLHDPLRGGVQVDPIQDTSVAKPPGLLSPSDRALPFGQELTPDEPRSMREMVNPNWGLDSRAIDSTPTPQIFHGPFFTSETPQPFRHSQEWIDTLDRWFRNGNEVDRQEDFFNTIMALNGKGTTCDPVVTRLMVPVIENLMNYQMAKPGMTRFTAPAEWCIDRSPSGNRSFFEQDCGKVPQRIGRDERYRHLAYEGRQTERRRIVPRVPTGLRFG